ncbi:MAG: Cleavage and polyadenylation specificity factor subunit 4 [Paramarteilia canceri]
MPDPLKLMECLSFELERRVEAQENKFPLPFRGMDKTNHPECREFNTTNNCSLGDLCPYRHITSEKTVVCKHWLRGLCKKGDSCEFLHEYNMKCMPECSCSNKDCDFVHIDPSVKIKDCPWYDRGFCRHGSACKNKHVRKIVCPRYIVGFCSLGPNCSKKQ